MSSNNNSINNSNNNKSVPESPSASLSTADPDYVGLVRFLIEPFLESKTALSVDCERANNQERVWIRLAFEGADKGRVYGRGGRNIQAIRSVIQAIAQSAGHSAYLDIYDEDTSNGTPRREGTSGGRSSVRRGSPSRSSISKPAPKFRS